MQNNISHRLSSNPGVLAFTLNIDKLKSQETIAITPLQWLKRASNTLASMGTGASGALNGQHTMPVKSDRVSRNPSAANFPAAVDAAACSKYKALNEQIKPLAGKLVNFSERSDIRNDDFIRGVWTEYNLSLLKNLLGTSMQPGTVAKLSPQGQLQKLLIIMCNFDSLERNHKLFVFQRMKYILSSWQGKFTSTRQIGHMKGKGLVYFSRHCLRYYPKQYLSHVYDYLLQTASRLAPVYRDDIIRQLMIHFPDLCQHAPTETHFSYFKSILKGAFFCSKEVRSYIFNGLSKNLILLPNNLVKDAAVLMDMCAEKFMSKRLHHNLGKNISYFLKEEVVHFQIDIINSNFYSSILTKRKK